MIVVDFNEMTQKEQKQVEKHLKVSFVIRDGKIVGTKNMEENNENRK